MDSEIPSPPMTGSTVQGISRGFRLPSTSATSGVMVSAATARRMASWVAPQILCVSISSTLAMPIPCRMSRRDEFGEQVFARRAVQLFTVVQAARFGIPGAKDKRCGNDGAGPRATAGFIHPADTGGGVLQFQFEVRHGADDSEEKRERKKIMEA